MRGREGGREQRQQPRNTLAMVPLECAIEISSIFGLLLGLQFMRLQIGFIPTVSQTNTIF